MQQSIARTDWRQSRVVCSVQRLSWESTIWTILCESMQTTNRILLPRIFAHVPVNLLSHIIRASQFHAGCRILNITMLQGISNVQCNNKYKFQDSFLPSSIFHRCRISKIYLSQCCKLMGAQSAEDEMILKFFLISPYCICAMQLVYLSY